MTKTQNNSCELVIDENFRREVEPGRFQYFKTHLTGALDKQRGWLTKGYVRWIFVINFGDMALRIRKDGRILCAAMHPKEDGDTYIDDALHYKMSCEFKVIGTEPMDKHKIHGQWWWLGNVPDGIEIEDFYLEK